MQCWQRVHHVDGSLLRTIAVVRPSQNGALAVPFGPRIQLSRQCHAFAISNRALVWQTVSSSSSSFRSRGWVHCPNLQCREQGLSWHPVFLCLGVVMVVCRHRASGCCSKPPAVVRVKMPNSRAPFKPLRLQSAAPAS